MSSNSLFRITNLSKKTVVNNVMINLILDLDNTIYPVTSIGQKVFGKVIELLDHPDYKLSKDLVENIKKDLMRLPFQKICKKYNLPQQLAETGIHILRNTVYTDPIEPFSGYHEIAELPINRFLVTTGFRKLQESKIESLNIKKDFKEIIVIDPETSMETKKDVFEKLLNKYTIDRADALIAGDDPESEIAAANQLGIKSFLLDPEGEYKDAQATYRGKDLAQLKGIIEKLS